MILEKSILPELYGGTQDRSVAQLYFLPSLSFFIHTYIYSLNQKFPYTLQNL